MRPTTYHRLTTVTVLVAIFAALMFDRVNGAKWAFLALGVLSGAAAVVFYFMNQWSVDAKNSNVPARISADAPTPALENLLDIYKTHGHLNEDVNNRTPLHDVTIAAVRDADASLFVGDNIFRIFAKDMRGLHRQGTYSRGLGQTYAGELARIVCQILAAREHDTLEFKIAADGSFTIRRNRRPGMTLEETFADHDVFQEIGN